MSRWIPVLALLGACAKHQPPTLYPTALPEPSPAAPAAFEAQPDECPEAAPLLPGTAPPFVEDGIAVCRAQVVPESQVIGLLQRADAGDYWEPVALACLDRSAADRLHGQTTVNVQHAQIQELRKEATGLRLAAPAAFVGGVIIGTGVGIAAAKINAL